MFGRNFSSPYFRLSESVLQGKNRSTAGQKWTQLSPSTWPTLDPRWAWGETIFGFCVSHFFPKAPSLLAWETASPSPHCRPDCPLPDLKQRAPGLSSHSGILQRRGTVESWHISSICDVFWTTAHSKDEQGQESSGYQFSFLLLQSSHSDFEKNERDFWGVVSPLLMMEMCSCGFCSLAYMRFWVLDLPAVTTTEKLPPWEEACLTMSSPTSLEPCPSAG